MRPSQPLNFGLFTFFSKVWIENPFPMIGNLLSPHRGSGQVLPGLHKPEICSYLNFTFNEEVRMRDGEIEKHITNFVSGRLQEDRNFRNWLLYKEEEKHVDK